MKEEKDKAKSASAAAPSPKGECAKGDCASCDRKDTDTCCAVSGSCASAAKGGCAGRQGGCGGCGGCDIRGKLHSYNYWEDIPGGYADDDMV